MPISRIFIAALAVLSIPSLGPSAQPKSDVDKRRILGCGEGLAAA